MKDDMPSLEAVGTTYNVGLPSEGAMYDLSLNERARFGDTPETKFIRLSSGLSGWDWARASSGEWPGALRQSQR